jgi:hypothetical protein
LLIALDLEGIVYIHFGLLMADIDQGSMEGKTLVFFPSVKIQLDKDRNHFVPVLIGTFLYHKHHMIHHFHCQLSCTLVENSLRMGLEQQHVKVVHQGTRQLTMEMVYHVMLVIQESTNQNRDKMIAIFVQLDFHRRKKNKCFAFHATLVDISH